MKQMSLGSKTPRQTKNTSQTDSPASQNAVSLAPPDYGIDFVDSEPGVVMPLQRSSGLLIQAKLKIGSPGDIYEQEADKVADQVMSIPESAVGSSEQKERSSRTPVQLVQRTLPVGDNVSVDRESLPQSQSLSSGQTLSSQRRAFFESRLGHDFSCVRIHADARSAGMTDALSADAFAVGRDIYFGAGKFQPRTKKSDRLLGHELAHVIQQSRTDPALQPKLKITGKAADVSRAITLLNNGLFQYSVSIDKSGNVSISSNKDVGPPSPEQQALANRLTKVINDPKDVVMTASAGSKTLGGSYATGDFDIADLETYGVAGLIHEIEEQYQKQVKGLAYGSETTGAHSKGIAAESEVRGAKRGPQKVISSTMNADGTLDAVIEIPHTYPDGKVKTMVMTVKRNNIESVTWK